MNRPRIHMRSMLAAVSLLVLGAAIGVTADRTLHRRSHGDTILFSDIQRDPIGVMDQLLDLRPDQRNRIAVILAAHQSVMDSVWQNTHLRLQATIDTLVNEIAAVLDADQAEKFRTLAAEVHSTGRARRPH